MSIIKIGGNILENQAALSEFLDLFAGVPAPKILVHGGGKRTTELSRQLGVKVEMVDGRRITNTRSLEIAIMVYAGLFNKKLVAGLQGRNCNAIGLSGADADTIQAHKRPVKEIDYGFAGDVDGINNKSIHALLQSGLTPVFCALTHDGQGQLLNTNADTIASELAIGMSDLYETILFYCFEKPGVLSERDNDDSVITSITKAKYLSLLDEGVIADGMLPKLENCFHALGKHVKQVCIGDMNMFREGHTQFTTLTL